MVTQIFIRGLQFFAYHGVSSEERIVGHRFVLDLTCEVNQTAGISDRIEESVNYVEVASIAVGAATSGRFSTVERAATVIGERLISAFPTITAVTIRLGKIAPSIELTVAEVGVELRVSR